MKALLSLVVLLVFTTSSHSESLFQFLRKDTPDARKKQAEIEKKRVEDEKKAEKAEKEAKIEADKKEKEAKIEAEKKTKKAEKAEKDKTCQRYYGSAYSQYRQATRFLNDKVKLQQIQSDLILQVDECKESSFGRQIQDLMHKIEKRL